MPRQSEQKGRPSRRKQQTEPIELQIEKLNDEGIGIGRHQRKEVVVAGALAGERVQIEVEHEGQHRIVGRLVRVLQRSPDRATPACRQAKSCLGCSLIQMKPSAQLRFKQQKVSDALAAYPSLEQVRQQPAWEAPEPLGYRTTAKLALGRDRGRVKVGLYRRGSHDIIDLHDCPLHHPLINRVIEVVREEISRQKIYVYNPQRHTGLLRYLLVRVSPQRNEAMVTFVTTERNYREVTHLAKWLTRKVPEVVSVQQNVNSSEGNVIFGRDTLKMIGHQSLLDQVGDISLSISPSSFFQVNHCQAARIYELVRRWANLKRTEAAIDLYCGIGGIALHLAKDAGLVIGIEVVEEAVRNAEANARKNGISNCTFYAGDASEVMSDLAERLPSGQVAVVNPPRKGCDPEVLEKLVQLAPRMLIYVSCNPQTLARDLDLLADMGYRTEEVQPVDMFPQTPHVETVARLVPAAQNTGKNP